MKSTFTEEQTNNQSIFIDEETNSMLIQFSSIDKLNVWLNDYLNGNLISYTEADNIIFIMKQLIKS